MRVGKSLLLLLSTILVLLLGIPQIATAAEEKIEFSDKNLEDIVRKAIDKPSGDLFEKDVEGLTSLTAQSENIETLGGIEHLKSLTELNLAGNKINDLAPLKSLSGLKVLNLSENQIEDIKPLKELTNLERLYLSKPNQRY
ncbi:leucine-rich repeat domain-containing protein [Ectobacillus funiculus]